MNALTNAIGSGAAMPVSRAAIEAAVVELIDILDMLDGDPEAEDGDVDRCAAGDDDLADIADAWFYGPGDADDSEFATAEWHTLPAATRRAGEVDGRPLDSWRQYVHEDAEDDDPAEDDDADSAIDDGPCDDVDMDLEEQHPVWPSYGLDQTKGAARWVPADDLRATKPHRERIRRERCVPLTQGGWRLMTGYAL